MAQPQYSSEYPYGTQFPSNHTGAPTYGHVPPPQNESYQPSYTAQPTYQPAYTYQPSYSYPPPGPPPPPPPQYYAVPPVYASALPRPPPPQYQPVYSHYPVPPVYTPAFPHTPQAYSQYPPPPQQPQPVYSQYPPPLPQPQPVYSQYPPPLPQPQPAYSQRPSAQAHTSYSESATTQDDITGDYRVEELKEAQEVEEDLELKEIPAVIEGQTRRGRGRRNKYRNRNRNRAPSVDIEYWVEPDVTNTEASLSADASVRSPNPEMVTLEDPLAPIATRQPSPTTIPMATRPNWSPQSALTVSRRSSPQPWPFAEAEDKPTAESLEGELISSERTKRCLLRSRYNHGPSKAKRGLNQSKHAVKPTSR
ncbi:hypothetical protein BDV95DRAFT_604311 [Massariosphaeria phaeospora]|uniref:Uncharacterized protein n=1 Tax=Massariosphaeria phaeospora TaxID=100035 RepID=A0A7C8IBR9_9PLEO|nr:hypothetical protein BDV95DRAFT_604311 [Massariosphaeria phaeospora]